MIGYDDIVLSLSRRFDFKRVHGDWLDSRDIRQDLGTRDIYGLVSRSGDRDVVFRIRLDITDLGTVGQIRGRK